MSFYFIIKPKVHSIMSWSRDFFEEVRKIDPIVAAHISVLGFAASEQMLIGSIILFGTITSLEAIRSFKKLLTLGARINENQRFLLFSQLVNPPKTSNLSTLPHEDRIKEMLQIMSSKSSTSSSSNKRVLAVKLILANLNRR
jgi:hypothetical protein